MFCNWNTFYSGNINTTYNLNDITYQPNIATTEVTLLATTTGPESIIHTLPVTSEYDIQYKMLNSSIAGGICPQTSTQKGFIVLYPFLALFEGGPLASCSHLWTNALRYTTLNYELL